MSKVIRLVVKRSEVEIADYEVPDDALPEDILEWARTHTVELTPSVEFRRILTEDVLQASAELVRSVEVVESVEEVVGCELVEEDW